MEGKELVAVALLGSGHSHFDQPEVASFKLNAVQDSNQAVISVKGRTMSATVLKRVCDS